MRGSAAGAVRIIWRSSGPVAAGARVLLSARGIDAAGVAKVAFPSEDRVRDVVRNFDADGFSSLYPKSRGGPQLPRARHAPERLG